MRTTCGISRGSVVHPVAKTVRLPAWLLITSLIGGLNASVAAPPSELRTAFALTSPNGGEVLTTGTPVAVTWDAVDPAGYLELWLYKDGERYAYIGQASTDQLSYAWEICPFVNVGADYRVRARLLHPADPVSEDESDAPFAILGGAALPALTLTRPAGGEAWTADTTESITWTATNPTGDVQIWLMENVNTSGVQYSYLGSAPMADGQFNWPISSCVGDGTAYAILLRWSACDRVVEATNPTAFSIAGSFTPVLTVVAPSTGAVLTAGTSSVITWTSTATVGEVEVEVLKSGQSVVYVGRAPVGAGALPWLICPSIGNSTSYTARVALDACGVRAVGGGFQISGSSSATLTLTSPVGGTTWPAGSVQPITWTSTNLQGVVDIYVPDATDFHWGKVTVPVAAGRYDWPIAPTLAPGSSYRVRVLAFDCGTTLTASAAIALTSPTAPFGDVDGSGMVDLKDFAGLQSTFLGPGRWLLMPPASFFDVEPDGELDLADFAAFQAAQEGP